ncbi:MAG: endonuclease III [Chloroflexaceae bacterium]|jgi:endonuclease-3|nr:endonuclease III [Chloroflexaceae bacterium]
MLQLEFESPLKEKAWESYQRLLRDQYERELTPRRDPMRELISTMLSHRTTHANEEAAYNRMWERFGSWEGIRDAPVDELTEALKPATFPEVKAPNIKAALSRIIAERGSATIDFLAELPAAEGMRWLMSLPGVGLKTASLVLLFCFAKPVLPVDTHVHRVSQRLGLIGAKVDPTAAHALLLPLLPPEPHILYNFHVTLLRHGQRVCVWGTPRCGACVLRDLCDWYQAHS